MRSIAVAAAALLLVASPTFAAQITQNLPAGEGEGDLTPFDIHGSQFDPALGTLVSVSGELTGVVTPSFLRMTGPYPTTRLTTSWFLDGPGPQANSFAGSLPDQIVTPNDGKYTGAPTSVDLTFDFGDPAAFVGTGSPSMPLLEFGFNARTPDLGGAGGATDGTTFSGNLSLTYVYNAAANVPEPDSALTLGVGLLALVALRFAVRRNARTS